jgi:hypothetical protein
MSYETDIPELPAHHHHTYTRAKKRTNPNQERIQQPKMKHKIDLMRLVVLFLVALVKDVLGQGAPEPYPELFGYCAECGLAQPASPDPLVRYQWNPNVNQSLLQIYRVETPAFYVADPPESIRSDGDKILKTNLSTWVEIRGAGSLRLDWGVERAAWLEFTSPDLPEVDTGTLRAAISEFNSPYPGNTRTLTRYGNDTFRLETNEELYEGVRFTWLFFEKPTKPWHISRISLVAKVKPINYTGSFHSSYEGLTEVWYTGAYGVRLNMEANGFNSILIERGDRVAIQGDGHPTMAAALVAFSPYQMVKEMLHQTNSGDVDGHKVVDQYIMAYPLYWTMSVNDYFLASGDVQGFLKFAADAASIVDKRIVDFLQPGLDIVWMGWDDRLGNGWCFHSNEDSCTREAELTFAALVVRACRDLARSLRLAGNIEAARIFETSAKRLTRRLRRVPEWPRGFGLHAAAYAINAGIATEEDVEIMFESSPLNGATNVCSWSPFNQYWILQALGNANKMDHAIASIRLCWEPMVRLNKGCFLELFSPEWTTFLADGDKAPTMPSYCHPWSSGVTAWLSNVLGGVQPLLPGYRKYVATPYVSLLYPSVSTMVPTPIGPIAVNASLDHSRETSQLDYADIIVTISVQAPVSGIVGFQKSISNSRESSGLRENGHITVLLDGIEATGLSAKALGLSGLYVPTRESALLFVEISTRGFHIITIKYKTSCGHPSNLQTERRLPPASAGPGIVPYIPPFPEPRYPATVTVDRESKGDGLYRYGTDGYVLFGFDGGQDLSKLPSYIQNVTIANHGFSGWHELEREFLGSSKDDPTYLPYPRGLSGESGEQRNQNERSLGLVNRYQGSEWDAGLVLDISAAPQTTRRLGEVRSSGQARMQAQSVIVDIKATANTTKVSTSTGSIKLREDARSKLADSSFRLSIYSVAKDPTEKYAVRVMDLDTLNVIAPTGLISKYEGGLWWSVTYHGSIRLRLMGIDGVRISAVAFADGTFS